jgi:hypothetical protein
VQIAENWSRIRGRVEEWHPPVKPGDPGTLRLIVEDVEEVMSREGASHRNLLADAAGTTVDVVVPASAAQRVDPRKGSTAIIEVRRGKSAERVFAHPERITLTP